MKSLTRRQKWTYGGALGTLAAFGFGYAVYWYFVIRYRTMVTVRVRDSMIGNDDNLAAFIINMAMLTDSVTAKNAEAIKNSVIFYRSEGYTGFRLEYANSSKARAAQQMLVARHDVDAAIVHARSELPLLPEPTEA